MIRPPVYRLRNLAVLILSAATAVTLMTSLFGVANAAGRPKPKLVALGDSITAGVGGTPYRQSGECLRSLDGYPYLLGRQLGYDTFNVACSGAKISALSAPYLGQGPQFDALRDASVVTISVGANDVGALQMFTTEPLALLKPNFTASFTETKVRPFQTQLRNAYANVRKLSPNARVAVVGYANPFPETADRIKNCAIGFETGLGFAIPASFAIWMTGGDAGVVLDNIRASVVALNTAISTEAKAAGFTFVDTNAMFKSHDICSTAPYTWGTSNTPSEADRLHPTPAGYRVIANGIAQALRQAPQTTKQCKIVQSTSVDADENRVTTRKLVCPRPVSTRT